MNKNFKKVKLHNFYEQNSNLSLVKSLISETTGFWYNNKHPILSDTEAKFINSKIIESCPHCGSSQIVKNGKRKDGIQRYFCNDCKSYFTPMTNTIFDARKIPVSEWIEFLINIIQFHSTKSSTELNQNAITTGFYRLEKTFLVLKNCQKDIILGGNVYIDETFISLNKNKKKKPREKYLRGISRNKNCVAVATNKKEIIFIDAKCSKLSFKACRNAYKSHIKEGSTLIGDAEKSHNILCKELNLSSVTIASEVLKDEDDTTNPLRTINKLHYFLKLFLSAHKNFYRSELQDRLNLARFVLTPSMDMPMKLEWFLTRALNSPNLLRFRRFYEKKR